MAIESDALRVKIQTPENVIWEGEAEALSSENATGPFDILPGHANMITMINEKPIVIVTGGQSREFRFERALLSVADDLVGVFADITMDQEGFGGEEPNSENS